MAAFGNKTFFKRLKQACGKIISEIDEVKTTLHGVPSDNQIAAEKVNQLQGRVNDLKVKAMELKGSIEPKLSHTRDFYNDYNEIILEIEYLVSKQERYLQKYGYKPSEQCDASDQDNYEPSSAKAEEIMEDKENTQTTPDLFCSGVPFVKMKYNAYHNSPVFKNRKSSIENIIIPQKTVINDEIRAEIESKKSTPVLEVTPDKNEVLKVTASESVQPYADVTPTF